MTEGLFCSQCEEEIGLLGDHLRFLRTNVDTKILHSDCYDIALAKLTPDERLDIYA